MDKEITRPRVARPPSLALLFALFLRLGATTFGGPAMVAYVHKMAVEQHRWLDEETYRDGVALCQTILDERPDVFERHCSGSGHAGADCDHRTFVVYLVGGLLAGLSAALGVFVWVV